MANKYLIEAVVDSMDAALAAEAAGADRLELCCGLELGGLTPAGGLLVSICMRVSIPVFVLIRPRSGDFLYTDSEFETMRFEVDSARELGAAGVVAGILLPNGRIDIPRMQQICEAAFPMSVTFHRAFDRTRDAMQAMGDMIQTGCHRLLSSGLHPDAYQGREVLGTLQNHTQDRITIMPGGGITADNAAEIAQVTGAREIHFSAIKQVPSTMVFGGENQKVWVPAPEKITAIRAALEH